MPEFANPAMLWALGAVSVPVLIHLLHRRRYHRTPWAAMAFLRQARNERRRRVMLQDLLVLALRVAALALLALVFARPFLSRPIPGLGTVGGQDAAVFVLLDDSASMGLREGESTAFGRALELLPTVAAALTRSRAAVSLTVHLAGEPEAVFHSDRLRPADADRLRAALDGRAPTALSLECERQLVALADRARDVPTRSLHFYVVTDLRMRDWGKAADASLRPAVAEALRELQRRGRVVLVNTAPDEAPNVGLARVRCLEPLVYAATPVRCEVEIGNATARELPAGLLGVLVDGQSLPPAPAPPVPSGETRAVPVNLSLEAGYHGLEFRLEHEDAFPPDNRIYLALNSRESIRALVVEGAAGRRPSEGAGYYAQVALDPEPERRRGVEVDVRSPWALPELDLPDYAAVILCNVAQPGDPAALRRYVEEGGGLVLFLGDRVDREAWNGSLLDPGRGVLPARLIRVVEPPAAAGLGSMDFASPFLEPFEPWASLFGMIHVRRFWDVEPLGETQVLARYGGADSPPAILRRRLGRGCVLLVTTTAGDEWNNWARSEVGRVTYVSFLHRTVEQMARAREVDLNPPAGSALEMPLDLSRYERTALLRRPPREDELQVEPVPVPAAPRQDAAGLWLAGGPLRNAGLWSLELRLLKGGSETAYFAVNIDPQERDLARMPAEALRQAAAGRDSLQVLRYDDLRVRELLGPVRQYWPLLARLLLVVLLVESALAGLFGTPPAAPTRREAAR